jgi:hypothetical protein
LCLPGCHPARFSAPSPVPDRHHFKIIHILLESKTRKFKSFLWHILWDLCVHLVEYLRYLLALLVCAIGQNVDDRFPVAADAGDACPERSMDCFGICPLLQPIVRFNTLDCGNFL